MLQNTCFYRTTHDGCLCFCILLTITPISGNKQYSIRKYFSVNTYNMQKPVKRFTKQINWLVSMTWASSKRHLQTDHNWYYKFLFINSNILQSITWLLDYMNHNFWDFKGYNHDKNKTRQPKSACQTPT